MRPVGEWQPCWEVKFEAWRLSKNGRSGLLRFYVLYLFPYLFSQTAEEEITIFLIRMQTAKVCPEENLVNTE